MKRKNIILIIVALVLCSLALYGLFLRKITEKRYDKIMCYFITRNLVRNTSDFSTKIDVLMNFVHEDIHPFDKNHKTLDSSAIGDLIYGENRCDGQSTVFMRLARSIGITSRLLYLRDDSGVSPHTVAEVATPDKNWVIVDPLFNLEFRTKDGRLAGQSDIRNDLNILTGNKRIKLVSQFSERWSDPNFLKMYYNTPTYKMTIEGIDVDFLKVIPVAVLRPIINIIQNRYFRQIQQEIKDPFEFKFVKARGFHLLGYFKKSLKLYDEIINKSNNFGLVQKTEFYKAILLKDTGQHSKALNYIDAILEKGKNANYPSYLLGLKARIYERIGNSKEAEKIQREAYRDLEI
ncbi:MAG: transglutaminase-like domain-containing protein [Candidatus Omnitrophota bacterium]